MTQQQAMQTTAKNDFVEIKYTGFANDQIFDSNIEEDAQKINPKAKERKTVIVIGQGMVVSGLDKTLENKEIGKEYEISLTPKESFGDRKRELIKTIPLSVFHGHNVLPRAGMLLTLDNMLVKIVAVSGARVTADFNNPLAGKKIKYKFTISKKITDDKEKAESLFTFFLGFSPEFEMQEKSIKVKGPKNLETLINHCKVKFQELLNKEIIFEEAEEKEEKHEHKEDEEIKN